MPAPLEKSDGKAACSSKINEATGFYGWLLARPERAENLLKPKKHPQPVFFNLF